MKLSFLISVLAVGIVIVGQLNLIFLNFSSFEEEVKSVEGAFYFDKKFIPVMDEISAKIKCSFHRFNFLFKAAEIEEDEI